LDREWQINEEVADKVEAQIIGMQQQQEAQRLVSNGDGGTLLLCNRCAEEGLNATDGNQFNAFLHHLNPDDSCGCYFKNALWQHCDGCADGCNIFFILK